MNLLDQRVRTITDQLRRLSRRETFAMSPWNYKKGQFFTPEEADSSAPEYTEFGSSSRFYGPDGHYWFTQELTIPEELDGKPVWMKINTSFSSREDMRNPQFLVFVNGVVTQGVDVNHLDVQIAKEGRAGETLRIDLQAYTGTLGSEFYMSTNLVDVDEEVKDLYYDIIVPLRGLGRIEKDSRSWHAIVRSLNDTINLLDLRVPYSEAYYNSIDEARKFIAKDLYTDLAGNDEVVASCIGHTHIDVAWWWTVSQTKEKVVRSFATVLQLMDEYPDYKFIHSTPQVYKYVKDRYPEMFARIQERAKEGRWETNGTNWVEMDTNISSGESLTRQALYGKGFFRDNFGHENRVYWLPDTFGYNAQLPQLLKKSDVDYFMTTKISWSQVNKLPYDTYMWKGIDGSEVLTHMITTPAIGQNVKVDFNTTYNGLLHPDPIRGAWDRYQQKDINNDVLVAFGHGDGGGGPTREMLETEKRMAKGIVELPRTRQVFAQQYFEELEERVKDNPALPTWQGDLYLEYHRGTYTSMSRNKRSNRKTELALMDLELVASLTEEGIAYPTDELYEMWTMVLRNQFHDILPGTAINEVYEVTRVEYMEAKEQIRELQDERLKDLLGEGDKLSLFNPHGYTRNDVIELGDVDATALEAADGSVYPVQETADGQKIAYVENLPAKGYETFTKLTDAQEVAASFEVSEDGKLVETPFYTVSFDEDMLITSIYDKENDREVVENGKRANLLRMYEDKPIYYDNWDIDHFYHEKFWDVTNVESAEWTEVGPVRATLRLVRKESRSTITQDIHFYANNRRIDFETVADWDEFQHLLKVQMPVNVNTDEATFDIQFGNIKRKIHTNTSWDQARFESVGHWFVDMSEGHYGVSLLNDSKYGHSFKDGVMALSLIKSGIQPNPVSDREVHHFTYSLLPHAGDWKGKTYEEAYNLNQEVIVRDNTADNEKFSLVSVDQPNVIIETVKKAENGEGTIVRLYESENALTKVSLNWAKDFDSVEVVNLQERSLTAEEADAPVVEDGAIKFTIKPYEIYTLRIK